MDTNDGGCAPTPLQVMETERDYYREQVARLKVQVSSTDFIERLTAAVSHPSAILNEMDTTGDTWLTPYEGLTREGIMPELGISVLVGSNMDSGQRSVVYEVTGACEELADLLVAIGAVEYVKGRLGERVAA